MLTHHARYRVIYGDTDAMGVAYHANYLRWFEIGRTELLRSRGLPYTEIEFAGYLLPVAEARIKYMQPAKYDDTLIIEATLDPSYKGGLKFDYRILSEDQQCVHATGFTRHACQDRQGRVVRPPRLIREHLEKIQTRP